PVHWVKTYEHWMTNIRDWCISRQLWWGHRIPVWYNNTTKEIYCEVNPPADLENWHQDNDVLDTWASSWLWAQDVFTNEQDQKYYYPTDLLVTAPDIIFFWVARMIIAGTHFMGEIPFKDVYFTSLVRDEKGRKMSKSLGNSPDPLDLIEEYGADALRFTMTYIAPLGQDVLFSNEMVEIGRNFANKMWNAGRFLLMNAQNIKLDLRLKHKHIDFTDKWIISRFNKTIKEVNEALGKFEVNAASKIIYSYVWNDFCDWYVELAKSRLYHGDEEVKSALLSRAISLYEDMLKLVHPFMPFITEEIWQLLAERKAGESISISEFPKFNGDYVDEKAEREIAFVQEVVTAIRNIRGEINISPAKQINVFMKSTTVTIAQERYIKSLVKIDTLTVDENIDKPKSCASAVVKGCDIFIPLEGLIDFGVERARIEKEITRILGSFNAVRKKLENENFVAKAPAEVIERERMKMNDWQKSLEKLQTILEDLD
ncbi:MAG: class I tRNA ligase family protein, partial [Bacteroidota bacterium]